MQAPATHQHLITETARHEAARLGKGEAARQQLLLRVLQPATQPGATQTPETRLDRRRGDRRRP